MKPPFDVHSAHRWFAVECNNQAWDLVEAAQRTDADVELMIHAAHAACLHWLQVGTAINHLRALCLLTVAYAVARRGEGAVHYAEAAMQLNQQDHEQTGFDCAMVEGGAALAYEVAGQTQRSNEQRTRLMQLYDRLTDDDDRTVVGKLFGVA